MVMAAEHLRVRAEVEAGQVEVGKRVAVADVEEEVGAALVVAVLEHLDQREAEQPVVELDGAFHVAADQRGVVHAAGGRRRACVPRLEVLLGQLGAPCGECAATLFAVYAVAHTDSSAPSGPAVNTSAPESVRRTASPVASSPTSSSDPLPTATKRWTCGASGTVTDFAWLQATAPQHRVALVDVDGALVALAAGDAEPARRR